MVRPPVLPWNRPRVVGWKQSAPLPGQAPQATALALQCLFSESWKSDTSCQMFVPILSEDSSFSGFYLPDSVASDPEILTMLLEESQRDVGLVLHPTFSFTGCWQI